MSEDGTSALKGPGKHISTACTQCRKRKVKCDGKTPLCSNCILYKQPCVYNFGQDKRKQSTRKIIDFLTTRVQVLEILLEKHGIPIPSAANTTASPKSFDPKHSPSDNEQTCVPSMMPSVSALEFQLTQSEYLGPSQQSGFSICSEAATPQEISHHGSGELESPSLNRFAFCSPANDINGFVANSGNDPGFRAIKNPPASSFQFPTHSYTNRDNTGAFHGLHSNRSTYHESTKDHFGGGSSMRSQNSSSKSKERRTSSASWDNDDWVSRRQTTRRDESSSPKEISQDDDIVDQLSARMGSFQIAEDGQLRYFGATSNLHIVHNGQSSLFRAPTRSMRTGGEEALKQAGLALVVSPEVEYHLEQLYFSWEDPLIHVVDENMYYLEQKKWHSGQDGSPFYSETLKNAILAIGSKLSSSSKLNVAQPASEFFQSRAKALLEVEMDSPTVATVQALVIMSATEAALTRDARGWLYSGMAVRLSADLGLHLDLSEHVRAGKMTARELDVRKMTFWGVFIHDNMWSLYVGRPWGIILRDISVSRPSEQDSTNRHKTWKPVLDASDSIDPQYAVEIHDPIDLCTDSMITLAEMMSRLSKTLYAGKSLSDQDLSAFAAEMRADFSEWETNLPEELRVDVAQQDRMYLPHVLQLHLQFHAISIFIHRPLFSQTRLAHLQGSSMIRATLEASTLARQACIAAARSIVQLLQIYRRQHTLRRTNVQIVHLVFSAGLILIYNTCTSIGVEAEQALADLQICCEALSEIGQAYKNSIRALEVLICIKREWQSKERSHQLLGKRAIIPHSEEDSEQRKKRAVGPGQQESFLTGDLGPIPFGLQNPFDLLDDAGWDYGVDSGALEAGLSMFDPYGPFDFGSMGAIESDTRGQNVATVE